MTKFIYTYIVFGISQIAKQNKIKINFLSSAMLISCRLVSNDTKKICLFRMEYFLDAKYARHLIKTKILLS